MILGVRATAAAGEEGGGRPVMSGSFLRTNQICAAAASDVYLFNGESD